MNLKPFNLTAALAGEKVITRNGREVTQILHVSDAKIASEKIVCVIDGFVGMRYLSGKVFGGSIENEFDLFMAPKTRKGWINIYKANSGYVSSGMTIHKTKEDALSIYPNSRYLTSIAIEWEE